MNISTFINGWNWSNITVRRVLVIMMLLGGSNLYAQDSQAPDMSLIEFLGEGVKVDNDVVDPLAWQAMEKMTGSHQDNQKHQTQAQTSQDTGQQSGRQQDHE